MRRVLIDTVFGLWGLVNNLTRLRPSKRERYRVTIFGSARAKPGTFVYDLLSDAYVAVPGGIGTVLEATLVWQLCASRRSSCRSRRWSWTGIDSMSFMEG